MNPRLLVCLAVWVLLPGAAARAVELDDPGGIANATVRTELYRGGLAPAGCDIETEYKSLALAKCVYDIHTGNVNAGTATKPFTLGLFFDAWLRAAAYVTGGQVRAPEGVARDFFFYLETHRKELGLSLGQVCEGVRRDCERVEPVWRDWDAALDQAAKEKR